MRRNRAWEMHTQGHSNYAIAAELGVSNGRVSQYVKEAAREHPVSHLTPDERMAVAEGRWQLAEDAIRAEINKQRETGVRTVETTTDAQGRMVVKETVEHRIDPQLLKAWSTHSDRRARQMLGQLSPDTSVQSVNVNLVKDFLSQGDTQGKLSAQQWNEARRHSCLLSRGSERLTGRLQLHSYGPTSRR